LIIIKPLPVVTLKTTPHQKHFAENVSEREQSLKGMHPILCINTFIFTYLLTQQLNKQLTSKFMLADFFFTVQLHCFGSHGAIIR
jgi:hypothetical protein